MTAATASTPFRRITGLLAAAALGVGLLDAAQWQLGAELRGEQRPVLMSLAAQFLPWCWLAVLLPVVVHAADRWPLGPDRWRPNLGRHLGVMTGFALVHVTGAVLIAGALAISVLDWAALTVKIALFRFPIDALAYWAAVGGVHAERASALAREREQLAARLEARLVEAKLAALRDRLNPHFFFNTLNAVTTLALRRDHDGVIRTVDALSDLVRATLTEGRGQETTLAAELEFLDRYLEIERLRFGERLGLGREVDPSLLEAAVPTMLIQPLVENAVRHGAAIKPGPVRIDVRARRAGDRIEIEVADTGPGFGPNGGTGTGIGLASCRARLAGLYGDRAELICRSGPEGGAVVVVRLPHRIQG